MRPVVGVKGTSLPMPLPFTFFSGEETPTSLMAHDISLLSLHLMQEIGVHRTYTGEENMGIR